MIDLSQAHVWGASSVAALDAVMTNGRRGKTVELIGLDESSAQIHGRQLSSH